MGTRELLLVLGAIMLFAITSLSLNSALTYYKEKVWANEFEAAAIGLAQQYIEEAKTKSFDEVLTPTNIPDDFSSTLGPEGGEGYPGFNDFDDFNGLVDTVHTPRANYEVSIIVDYVSDVQPDSSLGSKSCYKRMTVTVSNPLLPAGSISLNFVKGYY